MTFCDWAAGIGNSEWDDDAAVWMDRREGWNSYEEFNSSCTVALSDSYSINLIIKKFLNLNMLEVFSDFRPQVSHAILRTWEILLGFCFYIKSLR